MTISEFYLKHGARKTARAVINARVKGMCGGLGLDDLPDTSEVANLIDSMEELIEANSKFLMRDEVKSQIKELLEEIDEGFLESLVYG